MSGGAWVPGDPVYPTEHPREEPPRGSCDRCGTWWSCADVTVCPVCPSGGAV